MDLKVLGRRRTGYNYFCLEAIKPAGYTVTAVRAGGLVDTYNNVAFIEWLHSGGQVFIHSQIHQAAITKDFTQNYESVTIKIAFKIEEEF
jgi:hypothetical protein